MEKKTKNLGGEFGEQNIVQRNVETEVERTLGTVLMADIQYMADRYGSIRLIYMAVYG